MGLCDLFLLWLAAQGTVPLAWSTVAFASEAVVDADTQMAQWNESYRAEMRPVRERLSLLVTAIHEGRISDLPTLCPPFGSVLADLDREALAGAGDPRVRGNLLQAFELLDEAVPMCHRSRFFELSFQLYKARYLIDVIDRQLSRYR